jgi:hypothetical protein
LITSFRCFLKLNSSLIHPAEHCVEWRKQGLQLAQVDLSIVISIQVDEPLVNEVFVDRDAQILPLEVLLDHVVQFVSIQRVALIRVKLIEIVSNCPLKGVLVLVLRLKLGVDLFKLLKSVGFYVHHLFGVFEESLVE